MIVDATRAKVILKKIRAKRKRVEERKELRAFKKQLREAIKHAYLFNFKAQCISTVDYAKSLEAKGYNIEVEPVTNGNDVYIGVDW